MRFLFTFVFGASQQEKREGQCRPRGERHGVGEGRGKGEEMVAGLPNASTAAGSGALIENVERAFSLEEMLISLELVHRVWRTGHGSQTGSHVCDRSRPYGVGTGIR